MSWLLTRRCREISNSCLRDACFLFEVATKVTKIIVASIQARIGSTGHGSELRKNSKTQRMDISEIRTNDWSKDRRSFKTEKSSLRNAFSSV